MEAGIAGRFSLGWLTSEHLSGTSTFLFTDIEGSTRLLHALGRDGFGELMADQQRLLREAFAAYRGQEIDTQGDSFFVAFRSATDAVSAAVAAQHAVAAHSWPGGAEVGVRMGIHSGEATTSGERYLGLSVVRAARIGAAAHGGQVLLSSSTRELVEDDLPEGVFLRDLGLVRLKDLERPERVWQLAAENLRLEFPPLRGAQRVKESAESAPTVAARGDAGWGGRGGGRGAGVRARQRLRTRDRTHASRGERRRSDRSLDRRSRRTQPRSEGAEGTPITSRTERGRSGLRTPPPTLSHASTRSRRRLGRRSQSATTQAGSRSGAPGSGWRTRSTGRFRESTPSRTSPSFRQSRSGTGLAVSPSARVRSGWRCSTTERSPGSTPPPAG